MTNTKTTEELAARANACHERVIASVRKSLYAARDAGRALIKAKKLVGHGNWDRWKEQNFDASKETARIYMRIAREWADVKELMSNGQTLSISDALGWLRTHEVYQRTDDERWGWQPPNEQMYRERVEMYRRKLCIQYRLSLQGSEPHVIAFLYEREHSRLEEGYDPVADMLTNSELLADLWADANEERAEVWYTSEKSDADEKKAQDVHDKAMIRGLRLLLLGGHALMQGDKLSLYQRSYFRDLVKRTEVLKKADKQALLARLAD
jgi:hypothetical protein